MGSAGHEDTAVRDRLLREDTDVQRVFVALEGGEAERAARWAGDGSAQKVRGMRP